MALSQKNYQNFARTELASAGDLNNTTNPITVTVNDGSVFGTITTGMRVTISLTTDPMNDASREVAEITSRTGNSITLSRPNAVAHTGAPYIFNAVFAADMTDLGAAVSALEAEVAPLASNIVAMPLAAYMKNPEYKLTDPIESANGDVDILTVPSGKRALLQNIHHRNVSGVSRERKYRFSIGGTLYMTAVNDTLTTNNNAFSTINFGYILEAGDKLVFRSNGTGMWQRLSYVLFDNTSPVKTAWKGGVSSGNNTVYTVPSGKSARIFDRDTLSVAVANPVGLLAMESGSSTFYQMVVPSGQSPSTTYQWAVAVSPSAASPTTLACAQCLEDGDFISVNSTDTNSAVLIGFNVVELDNP